MFSSHSNIVRGGFLFGPIAALVLTFVGTPQAHSPLTIQPSTSRVGVGNTTPFEPVDLIDSLKGI
jgi:hypothetical protein